MNTALLIPYYGDDMPIVFFDEVADEAWYKVYNDGGHYVATRVYRSQMKPKEARSKVIDGILASRTDCKECKPVYEKYQKIFFKKTKEKFKQEHPEVARYEKAAAYLAKHPDDKDSTQKELQEEQETLLEEIAEMKVPLTEVQEDLKKLRDIRYWVRKATPGTEESKEPPKKQPIKEVLQDKADEKKAQSTAQEQTKHRQQDMEL